MTIASSETHRVTVISGNIACLKTLNQLPCPRLFAGIQYHVDLIYMLSEISNMPPANTYKTSSDLIIGSWNLLVDPDILIQPCRGNAVIDSKKTESKAVENFRIESTGKSEAVLARNRNIRASSNVGGQSALTATLSSDHLDAEHSKYDTGDKISRQTSLSKSKQPEAINSVALPHEDQMCNTDLNVKGDLARHTKTRGTKRSFKYDVCAREFDRSDYLQRHAMIHTGERPHQCDKCKQSFARKYTLSMHKLTHTGERSFHCDICGLAFTRKSTLTMHTKLHTGEHLFQCTMCERAFTRKDRLTAHVKKTHADKYPFHCEIYQRTFSENKALVEHAKDHTRKRSLQCDICQREFSRIDKLKEHKRIHTGERPFQCDICQRKFNKKEYLKNHMNFHTGERPFECTTCGRTFTRKSNLLTHMDNHSDAPRFECDVCKTRFYQRATLINHKRTHSEDRNFKCEECNKAFKTYNTLFNHKKTHSNERPFICDICNAKFKRSCILSKHKQTHGKQQPYKTNKESSKISSKRFTNDRNHRQLEPGHNNEKYFKSSHCDASFTSTTTSNQHIKPKTHTTNSGTELTNPDDVSTTSQLPSVSNQPSTSGIHVNKSQDQEKCEEMDDVLAYDYLQTLPPPAPSWDSDYSLDYCEDDDFFYQNR